MLYKYYDCEVLKISVLGYAGFVQVGEYLEKMELEIGIVQRGF